MSIELFNLIINGGGTAILLWLVQDMRKEAREQRRQTWALLEYLIRQNDPTFSSSHLPIVPK